MRTGLTFVVACLGRGVASCLCVFVCVHVSVRLCASVCVSVCLSVFLSVSVCLCFCLSVCVHACVCYCMRASILIQLVHPCLLLVIFKSLILLLHHRGFIIELFLTEQSQGFHHRPCYSKKSIHRCFTIEHAILNRVFTGVSSSSMIF